MDRSMVVTAIFVFGTTLAGFVLSVFVFETDSPVTAGLLGTGGGAMLGSFIAAIATDEPLLGGKTDMAEKRGRSRSTQPGPRATAEDERDASKAL